MRIDKYLWHVRLYKTRSIAAEACHKNQVEVNGVQAKASREVKVGDTITVRKNQIHYKYLILAIPKSRIGAKLVAENIKDITPADTTDYAIASTLTTHKLRNGETIILLAKKYYGDKRLWPYIVKHNQLKDFNNVAIGQMIKIPVLQEKDTK
jgi:ribosome-associated heat shock protein Hsp15